MVVVFYKVAALALKVFSKPFIDHTKKIHLSQDAKATHPILRNIFIGLGNRFNYYQQLINQKFLKIQKTSAYKPLNDQLAIQKGINFFYQILLYLIILIAPVYEMYRSSAQSKQKSIKLEQTLKKLQARLGNLKTQIKQQKDLLAKRRIVIHPLIKNNGIKTTESIYKLNIKFPTKILHVYHLDTLL